MKVEEINTCSCQGLSKKKKISSWVSVFQIYQSEGLNDCLKFPRTGKVHSAFHYWTDKNPKISDTTEKFSKTLLGKGDI
jgi:hypothetical protein